MIGYSVEDNKSIIRNLSQQFLLGTLTEGVINGEIIKEEDEYILVKQYNRYDVSLTDLFDSSFEIFFTKKKVRKAKIIRLNFDDLDFVYEKQGSMKLMTFVNNRHKRRLYRHVSDALNMSKERKCRISKFYRSKEILDRGLINDIAECQEYVIRINNSYRGGLQ